MGDTKENMDIKKSGLSMTLDAIEERNYMTMFYLKVNRYTPGGSSPKDANINIPEDKKYQDVNNEKEYWQNKLGLLRKMDINVFHWYSHIR